MKQREEIHVADKEIEDSVVGGALILLHLPPFSSLLFFFQPEL